MKRNPSSYGLLSVLDVMMLSMSIESCLYIGVAPARRALKVVAIAKPPTVYFSACAIRSNPFKRFTCY